MRVGAAVLDAPFRDIRRPVDAPRTIVFGSDRLGQRIAEHLRQDDCGVLVVALQGSHLAGDTTRPDLVVTRGEAADAETLDAAGVAQAQAVLAVTDNDELNLAIALGAREVNPRVRLVLRQFNVRLAALLSAHLKDSVVLSLSDATAPTFAVAALVPGVSFALRAGEGFLVVRERPAQAETAASARVIARAGAEGVHWFPAGPPPPGARVLEAARLDELPRHVESEEERPPAASVPRAAAWWRPERALLLIVAALFFLLAAGTVVFHLGLGLSPIDAFYFISTIVTTVGFDDSRLRQATTLTKLAGIATMFAGLAVSAILIALLTNALVARSAEVVRGRFRWGLRDHIVVCGLGSIGLRIAQVLRELGEDVVAIDAKESGRFTTAARAAGVKLVVGDASHEESLAFANVAHARAVVAATSSDYGNLEIALTARSLAPGVPLVLRMFDPDLSRRVAASFGIQGTFSGATLGAGRFSGFAVDEGTRVASLSFAGEHYALHQALGSPGRTVADCAQRLGGVAIALLDAEGAVHLEWSEERLLREGESVVVVVHPG
jgi:Trk K+ transport system NAD-binding subunit